MERPTVECAFSATKPRAWAWTRTWTLLALLVATASHATPGAKEGSAANNEAVKAAADGTRVVELPPGANTPTAHPYTLRDTGLVYMIETQGGLVECAERTYRAVECRASSIGRLRLNRIWIVKRAGKWQRCSRPDEKAVCGAMTGLFTDSTVW